MCRKLYGMDDTRNFLENMKEQLDQNCPTPTSLLTEDDVIPALTKSPKKMRLPPIIRGDEFPAQYELEKRPPLVEHLFRAKDNVLLGAPSKMGKSWFYGNLAVCLASGRHFCDLEVKKSKVLIIDLELHRDDALDRLWRIAFEDGHRDIPKDLWLWCLRDYHYDLDLLITELDHRLDKIGGVDAIILDPIYMLGDAGFDENNANSVKSFLQDIAHLKAKHQSALLLTHHFSKGQKGRESHTDRISGSGAFQRWPDSLITLSAHKIPGHAVMEVTGRSMPKAQPWTLSMRPPVVKATDLKPEFQTDFKFKGD